MLMLASTTLEKIHAIPTQTWINFGLGVLIFIVAIFVIRKAAGMNKVLLSVIIFVVLTIVCFQWIYSRNEPKFLTPLVDKIAPFFPTAGSYGSKGKNLPAS